MPKEDVVKYLKLAAAAGYYSRKAIGMFFGLPLRKAKDGIDYLIRKHKLDKEEVGIGKS